MAAPAANVSPLHMPTHGLTWLLVSGLVVVRLLQRQLLTAPTNECLVVVHGRLQRGIIAGALRVLPLLDHWHDLGIDRLVSIAPEAVLASREVLPIALQDSQEMSSLRIRRSSPHARLSPGSKPGRLAPLARSSTGAPARSGCVGRSCWSRTRGS
jgi:hypothetical protein